MVAPPASNPPAVSPINRQCDTPDCDQAATHVHWLPNIVNCERVELACKDHDPGGYWLPLSDFETPAHGHVANKRGGGQAVTLFLRKLFPSW
jgi:hypothetical protein